MSIYSLNTRVYILSLLGPFRIEFPRTNQIQRVDLPCNIVFREVQRGRFLYLLVILHLPMLREGHLSLG